jgi:hypothetical protein
LVDPVFDTGIGNITVSAEFGRDDSGLYSNERMSWILTCQKRGARGKRDDQNEINKGGQQTYADTWNTFSGGTAQIGWLLAGL